ncbi:MAG: tetratricopeptide repeat protein [Desulfobacterales bacterium]|nr:tetratricopeptide repeat protein [Desulfobacterales bacterium]
MKDFNFKSINYCLLLLMISGCSNFKTVHNQALTTKTDMQPVYESINPDRLDTKPKKLVAEGIKALEQENYTEASTKFNEALQLRPDKSYYHLLNALTYHLIGLEGNHPSLELAEEGYKLAIKFDSSNWFANYFLGILYLERGQYEKAQAQLAEALILEPNDPAILNAFMYASYYSHRPDFAGGAIQSLDTSAFASRTLLKNAAMVTAALGDQKNAQQYYHQLQAQSQSPDEQAELEKLSRRLKDWQTFYSNTVRILNISSEGSDSTSTKETDVTKEEDVSESKSAVEEMSTNIDGFKTSEAMRTKMVIVDVVIILTEENITTARGVNLLNGLQIEFGNTLKTLPAYGYDWTKGATRTFNNTAVEQGNLPTQDRMENIGKNIVKALTIPAISYSLNIANAHNQRNEILARPTLVALADKTSTFFSGFELNASTISKDASGFSTAVNIEKQIGVKLTVTPSFMDDGRIMLSVSAERTFLRTPSADIQYENKIEASKNMVLANVVMRYGETLILSGLSEKEAETVRDGVPFLQDIPIIQYLFSKKATKDFQKSVLILMTPRPSEYIYQPENASAEYDQFLNEYEKPLESLRARYGDWFKPYPNWAPVFNHMQTNGLYREFRTGDVELEKWSDLRCLKQRFKQIIDFLYY